MPKHRYVGLFMALLLIACNIFGFPGEASAAEQPSTNTLASLALEQGQAFVLHYRQIRSGRFDWELRLATEPQGGETLEYTINHQPATGGTAKVLYSGAMTALVMSGSLENVAPGELYIALRNTATASDPELTASKIEFGTSFGPCLAADASLPPRLQIVSPQSEDALWGNETEVLLAVQAEPFFPVFLQGSEMPTAASADGYAEKLVALPAGLQHELTALSISPTGHVATSRRTVNKHLLSGPPSIEGAFSLQPTIKLHLPDASVIDLHQSSLWINGQAMMLHAETTGNVLYATPAENLPAGLNTARLHLIGRADTFGGKQPVLESYSWEFIAGGSRTVKLWPGKYSATINGETHSLDAAPFIDGASASTMVPFRFVAEAMGAKVGWLPGSRQVTFQLRARNIVLTLDSPLAEVDGETVPMPVAPRLVGSRTVIPLRFVSEQLGAQVNWDGPTRTITITTAE